MLTVVLGKTCSGKTAVVRELCKKYNYSKIVTYTTRPMRNGEKDGVDYNFIEKNTIQWNKLVKREFLEKVNIVDLFERIFA